MIIFLFPSIETPLTAPEGVWFTDDRIYHSQPDIIELNWLAGNLTQSRDATVTISLWGYRETSIWPEFLYIDVLAVSFFSFLPFLYELELYTPIMPFLPVTKKNSFNYIIHYSINIVQLNLICIGSNRYENVTTGHKVLNILTVSIYRVIQKVMNLS